MHLCPSSEPYRQRAQRLRPTDLACLAHRCVVQAHTLARAHSSTQRRAWSRTMSAKAFGKACPCGCAGEPAARKVGMLFLPPAYAGGTPTSVHGSASAGAVPVPLAKPLLWLGSMSMCAVGFSADSACKELKDSIPPNGPPLPGGLAVLFRSHAGAQDRLCEGTRLAKAFGKARPLRAAGVAVREKPTCTSSQHAWHDHFRRVAGVMLAAELGIARHIKRRNRRHTPNPKPNKAGQGSATRASQSPRSSAKTSQAEPRPSASHSKTKPKSMPFGPSPSPSLRPSLSPARSTPK
jgi:hypothetical protein